MQSSGPRAGSNSASFAHLQRSGSVGRSTCSSFIFERTACSLQYTSLTLRTQPPILLSVTVPGPESPPRAEEVPVFGANHVACRFALPRHRSVDATAP